MFCDVIGFSIERPSYAGQVGRGTHIVDLAGPTFRFRWKQSRRAHDMFKYRDERKCRLQSIANAAAVDSEYGNRRSTRAGSMTWPFTDAASVQDAASRHT